VQTVAYRENKSNAQESEGEAQRRSNPYPNSVRIRYGGDGGEDSRRRRGFPAAERLGKTRATTRGLEGGSLGFGSATV
jgi:hypothetical protein